MLLDRRIDVFALRESDDCSLEVGCIQHDPLGDHAAGSLAQDLEALRLRALFAPEMTSFAET
jgi:hypothetical protein